MFPKILLAIAILTSAAHASDIDVKSAGAISDGKTLSTAAFQKAIDDTSKSGGGTVRVPEGKYLIGTLALKDNVTLHLDKGALLLGSTDIKDYRVLDTFTEGTGKKSGLFLLGAVDAKNVALEGEGSIDGQGSALQKAEINGQRMRPFLVRWVRTDGVSVKGVHLTGSAMWCMHISQSKNVTVDSISILNRGNGNNDGIDLDSSDTVKVTNCDIDSHDDAMCLKATSSAACRNIEISNCKLKSDCAAVKFGTESVGDFENVSISNCQIRETKLGGIKILSVDGSHISHITIADCTMDGVDTPIFMRLGSRLKTFHEGDKAKTTGNIDNVTIKNLTVKGGKHVAIMMSGVPDHPIGPNINIENLNVQMAGGGNWDDTKGMPTEKEKDYPEIRMFGDPPAGALFGRHVDGLTIRNLKYDLAAPDHRPTVLLDDAAHVSCTQWSVPGGEESTPLIELNSCRQVMIDSVKPVKRANTFLQVWGNETRQIRVKNFQATDAGDFLTIAQNVIPDEIKKE